MWSFGGSGARADRVQRALKGIASGWTGVLHLTSVTGNAAIWIFEGAVYAVDLDGYVPAMPHRLLSAGRLTTAQVHELERIDPQVRCTGAAVVERGWCPIGIVTQTHQEYVLAGMGALLAPGKAGKGFRITATEAETTSVRCGMPMAPLAVLEAVASRAERLATDMATLEEVCARDGLMGALDVSWVAQANAGTPEAKEFEAFVHAVTEPTSLDAAAHRCGFTRAEAAHLAAVLSASGAIVPQPPRHPESSHAGALAVPEAWPGDA